MNYKYILKTLKLSKILQLMESKLFVGKRCTIVTYETTTLNATFAAWHPDGSEIIFRDLETPTRLQISTALLRTPDVLAVEFEQPVELP